MYASASELRKRLGSQKAGNDDALVRFLTVASEQVNKHTGRVFTEKDASATARLFRPEWSNVAWIDDCVTAGESPTVERRLTATADWETLTEDTDFIFEPINNLRDGRTWATDRITVITAATWFPADKAWPSLRVTANWGWPAVPEEVVEATLLQASKLADREKSPAGTLGVDGFGAVVRVQQGLDRDAAMLLTPFMREITR